MPLNINMSNLINVLQDLSKFEYLFTNTFPVKKKKIIIITEKQAKKLINKLINE
jgi:ribosomal protein S17E